MQCIGVQTVAIALFCNNSASQIWIQDQTSPAGSTPAGALIVIQIQYLINPGTTQVSDSFQLQVITGDGYLEGFKSTTLTVQMTQGQPFQSASVTPSSLVNQALTSYLFAITLSVAMQSQDYLVITLPPEVNLQAQPYQTLVCSGSGQIQTQCQYRNGQIYVQLQTSNNSPFAIGSQVAFTINNFINPLSTKPSESFTIEAMTSDLLYTISFQNSGIIVTTQEAEQIQTASVQALNGLLGQQSLYQFTFIPNSPLAQNAIIEIGIPTEISYAGQANCRMLQPVNQSVACFYSQSSKTFQISTQNTFVSQYPMQVTLTLGMLQNPAKPIVTSSFTLQTFTQDYFIMDQITSGLMIAQDCQYPCKTCGVSSSICTSCDLSTLYKNLINYTCVETCPSGFFSDANYLCFQCISSCSQCSGSSSFCTQCQNSSYFINPSTGKCVASCPDGQFADQDSMQCIPCSQDCSTCTNLTYCLSCPLSQFLYQGSCNAECPENTLPSGSDERTCMPCSSNCKECNQTTDQCLSCNLQSNYPYIYGSKCLNSCPTGMVPYSVDNALSCMQLQESIFPFPFLALSLVSVIVIGIIKIFRAKVHFKDAVIAMISLSITSNWAFLFYQVWINSFWQSSIILCYALGSQVLLNILWFILYLRWIRRDPLFREFINKKVCLELTVSFVALLVSFQFFRFISTSFSFASKKARSQDLEGQTLQDTRETAEDDFRTHISIRKHLNRSSLISIGSSFFPVVVQNIYNLFYTNSMRQVFYVDIESIVQTFLFSLILILDIIAKRKKIKHFQTLQHKAKYQTKLANNSNVSDISAKSKTTMLGLDLVNNEEDMKKLEQIMRKYMEIKTQDASSRILSEVSSVTQNHPGDFGNDSELVYKQTSFRGLFSNERDLNALNTQEDMNTATHRSCLRSSGMTAAQENRNMLFSEREVTSRKASDKSFVIDSSSSMHKLQDEEDHIQSAKTFKFRSHIVQDHTLKENLNPVQSTEDNIDFESTLTEKMKKQRSLPKLFLSNCNSNEHSSNQIMNQTISMVGSNKTPLRMLDTSPNQRQEEQLSQSPTFFDQEKQSSVQRNKQQHSGSTPHMNKTTEGKENVRDKTTNSKASGNNYSFAMKSEQRVPSQRQIPSFSVNNERYQFRDEIEEDQQLRLQLDNSYFESQRKDTEDEFIMKLHKIPNETCSDRDKFEEEQWQNLDQVIESGNPATETRNLTRSETKQTKGSKATLDDMLDNLISIASNEREPLRPLFFNQTLREAKLEVTRETQRVEQSSEIKVGDTSRLKKSLKKVQSTNKSPEKDTINTNQIPLLDTANLQDYTVYESIQLGELQDFQMKSQGLKFQIDHDMATNLATIENQGHSSKHNRSMSNKFKEQTMMMKPSNQLFNENDTSQLDQVTHDQTISYGDSSLAHISADQRPFILQKNTGNISRNLIRKNDHLSVPCIIDQSQQLNRAQCHSSHLNQSSATKDYTTQFSKKNLFGKALDSGRSPTKRNQESAESIRYRNPLSDEKDKGILQKSLRYKVGKTIMSNISGDSPMSLGVKKARLRNAEGNLRHTASSGLKRDEESIDYFKSRSRSIVEEKGRESRIIDFYNDPSDSSLQQPANLIFTKR